ncbi:regulator of G-protein signaling 9, isoform CRA_a [Rattus norvegicus]|uniref:Regulator of G-protein signaling 9, isoform CRA_a n=1 Tax=Rattus norvegicus TaxID=10116 RepID=A6HKA0_RAT|nr:regulator of G-protein signaling 9, isoform CRA_a [Rattus norvegicus]
MTPEQESLATRPRKRKSSAPGKAWRKGRRAEQGRAPERWSWQTPSDLGHTCSQTQVH